MATSIDWPTALPNRVSRGYSETVSINVLRTSMDAGPSKMRRVAPKPKVLNISMMLTVAQVATLESFVLNTLAGVARFNFPDPKDSLTNPNFDSNPAKIEVRIIPQDSGNYYTVSHIGGTFYNTSLSLEILP